MKRILLLIIIGIGPVLAHAQIEDPSKFDKTAGTHERTTKRGPYLTGRFFDNVFVNVGGGVNLYMGEGFKSGDLFDRLAPALDVSLGKWITPAVGVRLQYAGLSTTSFTNMSSLAEGDDLTKREFNVMNLHGDFLWNISNAFGGYNETRTWDVIPFIGFGAARSWDGNANMTESDDRWRPTANAGLINNFRLGEHVDLNLEARYMMVKSDFDGYTGSKNTDGMYALTAGISVKFGKKQGFKRPVTPDYTSYNQRIGVLEGSLNENRRELASAKQGLDESAATIQRIKRELEEAKAPVIINREAPASMDIFFAIGSYVVSEKDMKNLSNIAEYIRESPEKTFRVVGYADNSTGSVARNEQLSRQRAQSVADTLVYKFGVGRSQLKVESKGGVKLENNPSLDRMVKIE